MESIPSFTFHEILSREEQVGGRGAAVLTP